jgi:hypothetical protein
MPTLECQPEWVKSSLSFANGNCVEAADLSGGEVGVRNSGDAAGAVFCSTPDRWHAFIGGVRNGESALILQRSASAQAEAHASASSVLDKICA